jgi:hypothetical protein
VSHLNKILLEVWSFTSVSEIDSQLLLLLSGERPCGKMYHSAKMRCDRLPPFLRVPQAEEPVSILFSAM